MQGQEIFHNKKVYFFLKKNHQFLDISIFEIFLFFINTASDAPKKCFKWFLWAKLIGKEGKKCQIGGQTGEIRVLHAEKWVCWPPESQRPSLLDATPKIHVFTKISYSNILGDRIFFPKKKFFSTNFY